jgi:hypothetical protein
VGAVEIDKNKNIHVKMRSLPVYEDRHLAVQHTLACLDGFLRTLNHNLGSDPSNSEQLFHRVAWNDAFDGNLVPTLKIKLKRQGQSFLESFDNWMVRKSKTRLGKMRRKSNSVQISIGVYLAVGKR